MNIFEIYNYLVRARRDLWATLEAVPDGVLSRPLAVLLRTQGIKPPSLDLLFHLPSNVERPVLAARLERGCSE